MVARGEVWWGEAPDEKGRPFLQPFPKAMLVRRLGSPGAGRLHEMCAAAGAALDC